MMGLIDERFLHTASVHASSITLSVEHQFDTALAGACAHADDHFGNANTLTASGGVACYPTPVPHVAIYITPRYYQSPE